MISREVIELAEKYNAELWVLGDEPCPAYYLGFPRAKDCYINAIKIFHEVADFEEDVPVSSFPVSVLKNMKTVRKVSKDEFIKI